MNSYYYEIKKRVQSLEEHSSFPYKTIQSLL